MLDATYAVGLSGPGRLHDLFVTHEAMTPGDFKAGGAGLTLRYGFHPSPFGEAILVATERGVAGIGFVDDGDRAAALADMRRRWPRAEYAEDGPATAPLARRVFEPSRWRVEEPLRVVLIGTDFEVRVWKTLLRIPFGRATTYSDIAQTLGKPSAVPRGRGGRGQESHLLRRALPPGARPLRRAHRLPLGPHPQAGDSGLGGRAGKSRGLRKGRLRTQPARRDGL